MRRPSIFLLLCCGCGGIKYHLTGQPNVVTLVNLHPDQERGKLYSSNYQLNALLPRCTPVEIENVGSKQMRFVAHGRRYIYEFQVKLMVESISDHLDRIFATECPDPDLAGFSEIDKQGIREGRALEGMTRKAVIYALGPPPAHANPRLDSDRWKYWKNRFSSFLVTFDGDVVAASREEKEPEKEKATPRSYSAGAVVAVFDVEDGSGQLQPKVLNQLTDYLMAKCTQVMRVRVVPREQIRAQLADRKNESYRECFDESCQIELGKALAAEKSLATKLLRVGDQCAITATLYDLKTETAERGASARTGCQDSDLLSGLDAIVQELQ